MKKFIAPLLLTLIFAAASASAQTDRCYKNDGLKKNTLISFTVKGSKIVDGEYQSGSNAETTSSETYAFTGTKTGDLLTIHFSQSTPEELKQVKKLVWTMRTRSLKVQMYGKNYTTNRWGVYTATFDVCTDI